MSENEQQITFISSLELKNFMRFPQLKLEFHNHFHAIMGMNESGKTTILVALGMFISTFNHFISFPSNKQSIFPTANWISRATNNISWLNKEKGGWTHFFYKNDTKEKATIQGTINGITYSLHLNNEKEITFHPAPQSFDLLPWSFSGIPHTMPTETNLTQPPKILSDSDSAYRLVYNLLKEENKQQITSFLDIVFGKHYSLSVQTDMDENLQVFIESDGNKIEFAFTGSAFQRVFSTLTYLYWVIEKKNYPKVFLVEELEAQLHPKISQELLLELVRLSKQENVQIILTTHQHIHEIISTEQITVLENEKPIKMSKNAEG